MDVCTASTKLSSRNDDERRWPAVVARDAATDGQFLYSVETTGV